MPSTWHTISEFKVTASGQPQIQVAMFKLTIKSTTYSCIFLIKSGLANEVSNYNVEDNIIRQSKKVFYFIFLETNF